MVAILSGLGLQEKHFYGTMKLVKTQAKGGPNLDFRGKQHKISQIGGFSGRIDYPRTNLTS